MVAANNISSGGFSIDSIICCICCACYVGGISVSLGLDGYQQSREQNNHNKHSSRNLQGYRGAIREKPLGLVWATCRICYSCCRRFWGSLVHDATSESKRSRE